MKRSWIILAVAALLVFTGRSTGRAQTVGDASAVHPTLHRTVKIDGLDIFYREAGPKNAPTILLLHGFPTSSHMFRNLIPALSDRYHVVAPDYPGYGNSSMPTVNEFGYSFDRFAEIIEKLTEKLGLERYSLYLMDYGAPVGFRLAVKHPERVQALIVQNGNAYDEGLDNDFWEPIKAYWKSRKAFDEGLDNDWWKNVKASYKKPSMSNEEALRFLFTIGATQWQYTNGARNKEAISPDNWHVDQRLLDRPGNQEIQLQLFYDYGSNPPLYPQWQAYFREHQPPTLIVWGKNDEIFPAEGAYPYKRDLKKLEFHLLDTGHFALEEDGLLIAQHIRQFLRKNLGTPTHSHTMKPKAKSPVAIGAKTIVAAGVKFTVPQGWIDQKPSSSMRKAQFELPGEAGSAELVVYYFGLGGAGGREANVQRWLAQFSNPNRPTSEVQWETSTVTRNKLEHTVVKISGTYAPISMRPGVPAPTPKPDYAIYGIILEGGPQGTLFIKATGPKATIEVQAAALDAFDKSARLAE